MQKDPVMYSRMAPAPLFAREHHQPSKHTDTYAASYLNSSSSPYIGSEIYDQYQPKRYSHEQYRHQSKRQNHSRSGSLQTHNRPRIPNLSKPLPPPPPPQARAEAQAEGLYMPTLKSGQASAGVQPTIPPTIPETYPSPGSVTNSSPTELFPAPRSVSHSPPIMPERFAAARQTPRLPPPTVPELPASPLPPVQSSDPPILPPVISDPFLSPRLASHSPPPLPHFIITRSASKKRRLCTYTPLNTSSHPTYTLEQCDTHLLSIRRNGTAIAEIKTGHTGHHAKLTYHPSFARTEIERKGHGSLGQTYHYPVELAALGQTCDWTKDEAGGFVLRDGCMGTVVARADGPGAADAGKVEVLIEASEGALDEVVVSWMAVGEIEREDREDDGVLGLGLGRGRGRSVLGIGGGGFI